ncbi:MAG: S16 family serine protease [Candidatus Woesearchaeota archaeon]
MRLGIIIVCLALLAPFAYSQTMQNTLPLLAVAESENGRVGSVADLTVEIIPGSGRVFIDTYPLTQLDTQISTRIAKEIACTFTQVDCNQYDFIYTIRSGSTVIGGPSAGAAIAAVTVATLEGHQVNRRMSITGTVNSGGLVGPVGGIREKIEAASNNRIRTVMIPVGEIAMSDLRQMNVTNESNQTSSTPENGESFEQYGASLGVRVVKVGNLYDVLTELTGREYSLSYIDISLPEFYTETMGELANQLCQRTQEVVDSFDIMYNNNGTIIEIAPDSIQITGNATVLPNSSIDVNQTFQAVQDSLERSKAAMQSGSFYSAASFCYGAGLNAAFLANLHTDLDELSDSIQELFAESPVDRNYQTMTDLQTYMLVQERVVEAQDHFERAQNMTNHYQKLFRLVNAQERYMSAHSWSKFFAHHGEPIQISQSALRESCSIRIDEATQRRSYVQLYPFFSQREFPDLERAQEERQRGNVELCLFYASKAKASMDVLLSSIGLNADVSQFIDEKIAIANQIIFNQFQQGAFPIIGYSYYEYGISLREHDPFASLLYLQYAIELSNLDPYLPTTQRGQTSRQMSVRNDVELPKEALFLLGIIVGLVFSLLCFGSAHIVRAYRKSAKKQRKVIVKKKPRKRPARAKR